MTQPAKGKSGGDVKRAPEGFYTAKQAQLRLGMNKQTFYRAVDDGTITRVQLKLSKDGFYPIEEIDQLADERTLALLEHMAEKRMDPTVFRVATREDAQGILNVLDSLAWPGPPVALRWAWREINDQMDYVVAQNGMIMGYISITPYSPEALEARMSGRKQSWHMQASDILPFESEKSYDVFIGIVTRDVAHRSRYTKRLVFGVRHVLEDWAHKAIFIRRMYAVSDQPNGQELCDILGFEQQEARPGDVFPRYVLDLLLSEHPFAVRYREALQEVEE